MYTTTSLFIIHISLTNINAIKTWRIWRLQDSPDDASIQTAVHCTIKLLSCNPYLLCKIIYYKTTDNYWKTQWKTLLFQQLTLKIVFKISTLLWIQQNSGRMISWMKYYYLLYWEFYWSHSTCLTFALANKGLVCFKLVHNGIMWQGLSPNPWFHRFSLYLETQYFLSFCF